MSLFRHPSVMASTGALVVFACAEVATDLPWWAWATWAALTTMSVTQAVRARS